ncbi:hypothetical protein F2Q69_00005027 [Brassica cretica]|uniref:Uncharacterized protein n=1 Tax=Brassica cretica TaxID=69181 RepID=A0A8S9NWK7_BRACR|nr:hypothetical protein F2Q69_00005027 [Brassica cretica]
MLLRRQWRLLYLLWTGHESSEGSAGSVNMVLILKQKVKHLQHKLEEARADLNAKEARIQELEYSKIESEFEGIFQGKIEAEIKHLVPTERCLSTIESIVYAMKEMGEDTESLDNMLDFLNPWLEIKEDVKMRTLEFFFQEPLVKKLALEHISIKIS